MKMTLIHPKSETDAKMIRGTQISVLIMAIPLKATRPYYSLLLAMIDILLECLGAGQSCEIMFLLSANPFNVAL